MAIMAAVGCCRQAPFNEAAFSEVVYEPTHATGFCIKREPQSGAILISSRNPWQGAQGVQHNLLIDPDRHFVSQTSSNLQHITKRAERIVCMSSSHIAMLDAIGQVERVVGVSGIDFITNEYINANRDKIGDVGYDNNTNYEILIALDADLVLLYGVNAANSIEPKLRELQIPFAYIGDYVESSPLGKAEWMVAIGEIVGCRESSQQAFSLIAENYATTAKRIKDFTNGKAAPQVMLNTPYRDAWFIPSKNNYIVRLIEDAGGKTFTSEGEGNSSSPIDIEQAIQFATQSDVWLNPGSCNSLRELISQNPKFADTPAIKQGRVYNNNLRQTAMGGSDFWESGVVRPDIILRDLATILHPKMQDSTIKEGNLYYHKQLK